MAYDIDPASLPEEGEENDVGTKSYIKRIEKGAKKDLEDEK